MFLVSLRLMRPGQRLVNVNWHDRARLAAPIGAALWQADALVGLR